MKTRTEAKPAPERKSWVRRALGMAKEVVRLWQVWLTTFVLLGVVWALAPQQLGLSVYKASLVTLGALIGYWTDRWTFPKIRNATHPDQLHAMYRRAGLMGAGMLAFGLGA